MCSLGAASCFSVVNASNLTFEAALQVVVAQGLANRAHGDAVYVTGLPQFPGMVGIEWFPGTGCAGCSGLRERWLDTIAASTVPARRPVPLSARELLERVRPLLSGGAVYDAMALHSLGPVLTACGVHDLLPAASAASLPRGLAVKFDGRRRWTDALDAAWFVGRELLPHTNASTIALQAPTNLPFLADAIVAWRLPVFWMADMCRDRQQNAALRWIVEGSRHFDAAPVVQYLGWFNNTHMPNVRAGPLARSPALQFGHSLACPPDLGAYPPLRLYPMRPLPLAHLRLCLCFTVTSVSALGLCLTRIFSSALGLCLTRIFSSALGLRHLPSAAQVELVCQCTSQKRLVTIASDWAENLSFLSRMPPAATVDAPLKQPADAVQVRAYSPQRTYAAVVVSDGDNLAQDWSNLRPMLERRLSLHSRVPVSWTLSNRWGGEGGFGGGVLRYFYSMAYASGGYDSFLMGPSGYGYLFPGAIVSSDARAEFGRRTAAAATMLDMAAYVHWDVDVSLDPESRQRTERAVGMYNGTAVRGVFMLGSDPIADHIGDVVVVNAPAIPWGFTNATAAARTLNELPRGSVTYVYATMKADPALVDAMAAQLAPHVTLLGHRALLHVARLKLGMAHP